MFEQSKLLFADRATSLIAAACQSAFGKVVLLPALYCHDVADAIEACGLNYRCYDLEPDLSCSSEKIQRAMGRDVGCIVLLHAFGLLRTISRVDLPDDVIIIEDACHAIRTSWYRPEIGTLSDLVVYSPRKEFGWELGGIAAGPFVASIAHRISFDENVERRWQSVDINKLASVGQSMTKLAIDVLGRRLPNVELGEVLMALPLKSSRRDEVIGRLRSRKIPAWRWIKPLKGTGPFETPVAWKLREKLFLVPTEGDALNTAFKILEQESLEGWD